MMIELFQAIHKGFFEDDDSNLKTMMAGFVLCAVFMLAIFGAYQL